MDSTAQPQANWRKRLFAYAFGSFAPKAEWRFMHIKKPLFDAIFSPSNDALPNNIDTVLEIGMGPAPNLKYYADKVNRVIGIDYNQAMHWYAKEEVKRLGLDTDKVELITGVAENLPVPNDTVDVVVCTHVLCSVQDPQTALKECYRVLKPAGRLLFIEHVEAPEASRLHTIQHYARPINSLISDGCNCTRDTASTIESIGFSTVDIKRYDVALPFMLQIFSPHIAGICVK